MPGKELLTVKEIANELGVDKQTVYRIIKKNRINAAVQEGQLNRYDKAVKSIVESELPNREPHQNRINEPHQNCINEAVVALLQKELEAKNELIKAQQKTIDRLTSTVEAYSQKELAGKLIEGHKMIGYSSDPTEQEGSKKKKGWNFWKR